jgi:hypothetical protein
MQILHGWQYTRHNLPHLQHLRTSKARTPNTWNNKADIKRIPIVISRTCTFNVKTLAKIAQFVSYKEEPPDVMTYKQLPKQSTHIATSLHKHTQEWLSHISKYSRKILTTNQKTTTLANTTQILKLLPDDITFLGGGMRRRRR